MPHEHELVRSPLEGMFEGEQTHKAIMDDAKLVNQALNHNWTVSPHILAKLADRIMALIESYNVENNLSGAAKLGDLLVKMNEANWKHLHPVEKANAQPSVAAGAGSNVTVIFTKMEQYAKDADLALPPGVPQPQLLDIPVVPNPVPAILAKETVPVNVEPADDHSE